MFLIHWTKNFSKTYWRPVFHHRTDKNGLWYWDVKFLRVQACLYSRDMAQKFLEAVRDKVCKNKESRCSTND